MDLCKNMRHLVTWFPAAGLNTGYHRPHVSRPAAMKHKKRAKTHKRTSTHKKRHSTRRTTGAGQGVRTVPSPSPPPTHISTAKTCQEAEVGDIGGFGSPEELEAHERCCGRVATEFCNTCARNLCGNHYELIHRDHDTTSGYSASQGVTGQ